jgi:pSer/pThr/pTyr-binding forkhead associated (FHA) protein
MNCKNCGRQNPSGSLYCQDCGHRLGDWVPPEKPQKMPTPPTGISRQRSPMGAPVAELAAPPCPRCGTTNAPHMRFCNNCGYSIGPQPQAQAPAAPVMASSGAPTCWRCRAVGDVGAEFCKFCGARYADDPSRMQAQPSAGAALAAYAAPNGGGPVMMGAPSPVAPQSGYASMNQPVAQAQAGYGSAAQAGYASVSQPRPAAPAAAGYASVNQAPVASAPAQAAPPREPMPTSDAARAVLVAILKDGSDGRVFQVHQEQTDIGRIEGDLVLSDDPYLSPRHARIVHKGGDSIVLRDLDSLNGVYVRLRDPVDIDDGDMALLGQQVVRFEVLEETELPLGPATQRGVLVFGTPEVPRIARLVQYTTEGVGRDVHYLYRDETVIGREQGDIVCTDDPFMSRRHAAITIDRTTRKFVLRDLGSSNGTAIRIRGERTLRPGDQFRVGRHLFRYDRPGDGRPDGGRPGDGGRAGA